MVSHEKCHRGEAVDRLTALQGTGHLPFFSAIPCRLLHPNISCVENALNVFPEAYLRSLTVYLPVYLAPAVLVHRKRLFTESNKVLPKVLMGVMRSSFFLSSFITLAYSGSLLSLCLKHVPSQGCVLCIMRLGSQVNGPFWDRCWLQGSHCWWRRRVGVWSWHCIPCPEQQNHFSTVWLNGATWKRWMLVLMCWSSVLQQRLSHTAIQTMKAHIVMPSGLDLSSRAVEIFSVS